ALALASRGADIALAARSSGELEAVAAEVRRAGQRAWVMPTDLGDLGQTAELIRAAHQAMGGVDILVNNAGGGSVLPGGVGPLLEVTPAAFEAVYTLNLKSPLFAAIGAAAYMKQQSTGGCILNIASIDGTAPAPGEGLYGMAKAGLIYFTSTLAIELGRYRIRVNAIAPGLTDTALTSVEVQSEAQRASRTSFYPINRIGRPEDIAAAALYLCSDEAGWVSGETLLVAGGAKVSSNYFRWLRAENPVPVEYRI
ncbi:MAG: SDR family NAD(P)-dependent oxidoreductase, partial [Chloroflexota bacterium]